MQAEVLIFPKILDQKTTQFIQIQKNSTIWNI